MAKPKTKTIKRKTHRAAPKASAPKNDVFERVQQIIARQLKKNPSDVTLTSSLQTDLSADSLDAMEIVFQLEEEFNIKISEEEANKITTVQTIVASVSRKIKN